MMEFPETDQNADWERMLAASMHARPERRWGDGADLAAAAMARARAQQQRALQLSRMARRAQWVTLAGTLLLLLVLGASLYCGVQQSATAGSETGNSAALGSENTNTSSSEVDIAGVLFLLLLAAGVAAKSVLASDRESVSWEAVVAPS